jgi:hypothetical protein
MNKTSLPLRKSRLLTSEDLPISDNPNVPTRQHDHFHKKWLCKLLPSMIQNRLHIITDYPFNLEIVPDPDTEITLKKEMYSILMHPHRAQLTVIYICDIPMPTLQQISSV